MINPADVVDLVDLTQERACGDISPGHNGMSPSDAARCEQLQLSVDSARYEVVSRDDLATTG